MNLAKYSLDNTKIIYFFLAVLLIQLVGKELEVLPPSESWARKKMPPSLSNQRSS